MLWAQALDIPATSCAGKLPPEKVTFIFVQQNVQQFAQHECGILSNLLFYSAELRGLRRVPRSSSPLRPLQYFQ
jgi:hypothetical protein